MVVAVAGPIDHDEALTLVVVGVRRRRPPGDGAVASRRRGRSAAIDSIDDDTEQVHIVMGGRALARGDEDREALDVVNHVFGGGLSSRLFEEIRERRGLAYSVYSGVSGYADGGAFQMYAGTQPEHADEVIGLMRAELDRLVSDGDHRRGARRRRRLPHRRVRARPRGHRGAHGPQRRPADHHRVGPPDRRAGGSGGQPSTRRPCKRIDRTRSSPPTPSSSPSAREL